MTDPNPDLDALKALLEPGPPSPPETLQSAFARWQQRFEEDLKEDRDNDTYAFESCLLVGERTGRAILSWCEQHNEPAPELSSKLWYVKGLITQLYDALAQRDGLTSKKRFNFWRHVDVASIIQPGKREERENFLDRQSLKILADLYLARPWMQNADLDWIFPTR